MKVEIEVEVPEQFKRDVLTIAVEGGINYWSNFRNVTRDPVTLDVLSVVLVEDGDSEKFSVDTSSVERGLTLLLNGHVKAPAVLPSLHRALTLLIEGDEDAASEIDADGADCIIQAALFGTVVYG